MYRTFIASFFSLAVGLALVAAPSAFAESKSNESQGNGFLIRSMLKGMSGGDISNLQTFLAQDPSIYPEGLITGFFGDNTEKAVKRFQKKHGLDQAGRVGPKTRALILELLRQNGSSTTITLPVGLVKNLLRDRKSLDDDDDETDHHGTSTNSGKAVLCHKEGKKGGKTIVVGTPAVRAHLAHGDREGRCEGEQGNNNQSDKVAPVISSLSVSNISSSTATVSWSTNEVADTKLWLSTTTPTLLASPTWSVSTGAFTLSHTAQINALTASTTYFFVVQSKDPSGNAATSSQQSFITQ